MHRVLFSKACVAVLKEYVARNQPWNMAQVEQDVSVLLIMYHELYHGRACSFVG